VTNPAVNGFSTQDLIGKELVYLRQAKPDVVTVLIGVNDLVRGRSPISTVRRWRRSTTRSRSWGFRAGRIAAISIPDWSVAPAASGYGSPKHLCDLTTTFNDVARGEAEARGFLWVDLTPVSTSGLGSPGWIASDDLHPGDAQYAAWAETIWSAVGERWGAS
jgi:lysophospholipase L1-like esterase